MVMRKLDDSWCRSVVSQRRHILLQNRPVQHGIRIPSLSGSHPEPCARGKLANHRIRHHRLRVISLGIRSKDRHGERLHIGRQVCSGA